jgi:hypothetical protein
MSGMKASKGSDLPSESYLRFGPRPSITGQKPEGNMEVHVTDRGLQCIHFTDEQGQPGILQQSPEIDYSNPTDVPNTS